MSLLKNSYVLGLFMVIGEMVINVVLHAADLGNISGILMASIVGMIYAQQHQEKMPRVERLKALAVYVILAGAIGSLALLSNEAITGISPAVIIGILAGTLLIYALIMYWTLGFGGGMYLRSVQNQKK